MPSISLDERWERRFRAARRHMKLKELALEYKGGACVICGYDRCPAALHFHYDDPEDREYPISSCSSWGKMKRALDRTTLLCANCRAETLAGWHPQHLALDERGHV